MQQAIVLQPDLAATPPHGRYAVFVRFFAAALFLVLSGSPAAEAQTAELTGRVTDAQGAVLPGVTVTAAAPGLAAPATAASDDTGDYALGLAPGVYTVTFTLTGFDPRQEEVTLTAGSPLVLDVTLSLATITEEVDVVAITPIRGAGIPRERLPAAVSVIDGGDLAARGASSMADALNERLGSVTLEGTTTNLFQPTLRFRGFTASPLLGLPQGIAVYQNGVRINEPFGDTVQFDLFPQFAVDRVQLSAGADPTYGLNALGGALALDLKNGFDHTRASGARSRADRSGATPPPPSTAPTAAPGPSIPARRTSRRRGGASPRRPR